MINFLKNIFNFDKEELPVKKSVDERIEEMFSELEERNVSIKIGEDLTDFAENLCIKISEFRESLFEKTGFIFPSVRVFKSEDLQENEFQILLRGKKVKTGYTYLNQDDATNEIMLTLENTYYENIEKIFSNEILEKYIDRVQKQNAWMVWNLTNAIPIWGIKLILVNILKSGKSIKDINYIFDKIWKLATKNRDICIKADPYIISEKICSELSK